MNLTANQLHTLRHMLGINTPYDRVPRPTRDYAAVNPNDPEFTELECLGAVEIYSVAGNYNWYKTTEAGRLAAMRSHRQIRVSRAARRYAKWLDIHEAWEDVTFHVFLTHPDFAEARRSA